MIPQAAFSRGLRFVRRAAICWMSKDRAAQAALVSLPSADAGTGVAAMNE
ncbi:hypothetical protein FHT08_003634 [Xanthomonas campestris]|nr:MULTISPECIES: hypothetical protein [Xanthomonas]NIJ78500.1 hypothetical protein [Xanthomonas sp. CFBP 8151]